MKTTRLIVTLFAGLLVSGIRPLPAQTVDEAVKVATVSEGTVTEFGPHTLIVKSEISPQPFTYTYNKTTTYVDEAGSPVSIETVKSGAPVMVYFDRDGEEMVAKKVVVKKVKPQGAVTVTSTAPIVAAGTISDFSPTAFEIKTASGPVHYRYTKTTTYVDENDAPVAQETLKTGIPVTVYYETVGNEIVAKKIVVRKTAQVEPDSSAVIEHKKTTTTEIKK